MKTLGFSGVTLGGTLFAKKLLVFRGSVRSHPFISLFWKKSSHYTWTKGCRLGGCFGKKLCKLAIFLAESCHTPVKIRSATLHGCSQKRSLTLLPQHEGRKNDTIFLIFSKFFWDVLFPYGQHAGLSLIPAMAAERIKGKWPA